MHPIRTGVATVLAGTSALAIAVVISRFFGHHAAAQNLGRLLKWLLWTEAGACVLIMACGFIYEQRARGREKKILPKNGRFVRVGETSLFLQCSGEGDKTVILEHGLEGARSDWRKVAPELARFARVCLYDPAGYGWSGSSASARTPKVMAQELHTLLQTSGEKPPYILVGHSFGGFNALMFAHLFPDEVGGVVLVDSLHPSVHLPFEMKRKLWLKAMQLAVLFGLPRWRSLCGTGPAGEFVTTTCHSRFYRTIQRERAAFPESADQIRAITDLGAIPLVVITRDPKLEGGEAHANLERTFLALSKESQFVIAHGSGHDVPLARPDIVIEAVKNLLKPQAPAGNRESP